MEYRIVDPTIAHELALREATKRYRVEYALGAILGGVAMGDPFSERVAGCIASAVSENFPDLMRPERWHARPSSTPGSESPNDNS